MQRQGTPVAAGGEAFGGPSASRIGEPPPITSPIKESNIEKRKFIASCALRRRGYKGPPVHTSPLSAIQTKCYTEVSSVLHSYRMSVNRPTPWPSWPTVLPLGFRLGSSTFAVTCDDGSASSGLKYHPQSICSGGRHLQQLNIHFCSDIAVHNMCAVGLSTDPRRCPPDRPRR